MTHRDWCITAWTEPKFNEEEMRYLIVGKETCPKTGKEHFQCFVKYYKQKRLKGAKELFNKEDHFEPRMGSVESAVEYCKKEGNFQEYGKAQAEKLTVSDILKKDIKYIKEEYPLLYCRYYKGIERLQSKGEKWRDINIIYIYGEAGCGKTRFAMERDNVFKLDPPYKWFDGYEGEETLVIDDFKEFSIDRAYILNIMDGYRLRLETKGSHTWARWTQIIITSNYEPPADKAFRRRLNEIRQM